MSLGLANVSGAFASPPDSDVRENDGVMARLVGSAVGFLRAGGSLSWSDWARMDSIERDVFVEAGNIVFADRASVLGIAVQGRLEALSVGAVADGGAALADAGMESVLRGLVGRAKSGAPS